MHQQSGFCEYCIAATGTFTPTEASAMVPESTTSLVLSASQLFADATSEVDHDIA
jgi:hypothetical protein